MDFLRKARNGEFTGVKRAFGGGKHSADASEGITTTADGAVMGGRPSRVAKQVWDDEDGTSPLNVLVRGLQCFLPFVNLCIYIALAAFQAKWGVGVSFLTGLGLFFNIQSLLHGILFLGTPLLYDRLAFLRGVARGLRQIRIGVIINAAQAAGMLLMALVTTISANLAGCKNAADDAHADLDGYTDALGPFCRNKRAGAAFFWLNFFAWSTTLTFVLLTWRQIRKAPKSTGFALPSSSSRADPDAFAPSSDVDEPETSTLGAGGYRPSGDYYAGEGLFSESAPGYGEDQYHPRATDPFEDQESGGAYAGVGRYEEEDTDPYAAIRKSMDTPGARPSY